MASYMHRRKINMTPPQILALSFLTVIAAGTLLLLLPISAVEPVRFTDALFTAVSATTVTGLIVRDTGTVYTIFGQIVIMILIKIGGLGLLTVAMMIVILLGKKIGLKERLRIQQSFNQTSIGGIVKLVKVLFIFSVSMEALAAALLAIDWVPEYGWRYGLFTSLFHSISAFNNAGFSLWSDGLTKYVGDPLVNVIITGLFITGGIGFTVLYDVIENKRFKSLQVHSKIMIVGTLVINVSAAIIIFLLESNNPGTMASLSLGDKLWASYFQAVTPRTAGFNSVDITQIEPGTALLMSFLMFVGGGSASTASGIKLTTFIVIIWAVITFFKGEEEPVLFKRSIPQAVIARSFIITVTSLMLVFAALFLLTLTEQAPFLVIVFEVFSAFGTVGLSMGLTYELTEPGKYILMLLMFFGRIGPLTIVFALARTEKSNVRYPRADIYTG